MRNKRGNRRGTFCANLTDELRWIRCRVIVEKTVSPDSENYQEQVAHLYRRSLAAELDAGAKKERLVVIRSARPQLAALRQSVEQLALRALVAGASVTAILENVGAGLDRASEISSTTLERPRAAIR
jgi:hypothetical protein